MVDIGDPILVIKWPRRWWVTLRRISKINENILVSHFLAQSVPNLRVSFRRFEFIFKETMKRSRRWDWQDIFRGLVTFPLSNLSQSLSNVEEYRIFNKIFPFKNILNNLEKKHSRMFRLCEMIYERIYERWILTDFVTYPSPSLSIKRKSLSALLCSPMNSSKESRPSWSFCFLFIIIWLFNYLLV